MPRAWPEWGDGPVSATARLKGSVSASLAPSEARQKIGIPGAKLPGRARKPSGSS